MNIKREGMVKMSDVLIEKQGSLLILTLNRPERLNAFSDEMIRSLTKELQQAQGDDSVKVVILRGSGRIFTSGGDIKEMEKASAQDVYEHVGELNQCILAMQRLEKPIVAAVHGFAAGAGFNLALASDFIIAAIETKFVLSFSQVGLIPDCGGLYFLPRLLSPQKVKELLFFAEPITAKEAYAYGLINRTVPIEELQDEVMQFALRLSKGPLKAYGQIKKIMHTSSHLSLEQVLEKERLTQTLMFETEDHKEGVKAFQEKRIPNFKGK